MGSRMRDGDIRTALDALLRTRHAGEVDTLIRHELGVCAGRRRVDVAVLNGEIAGYEIKSDEDTLTRLAGQAEAYSQVLDRATLVTTTRHVEKALEKLPAWWGVMIANADDGTVVIEPSRDAALNLAYDAYAVAQLLWREEALSELKQRGLARGLSRMARHWVWVALAHALDIDELRDVVRRRIKGRSDWSGGQRHAPGDATFRTLAIPSLDRDCPSL